LCALLNCLAQLVYPMSWIKGKNTHRFKRISRINTVRDYSSIAVPIIVLGYCFVFLLASCVPNLKFYLQVINFCNSPYIIDSNGHDIIINELIFPISVQQTTFPNSRIPNYDHFHRIVVIWAILLLLGRLHFRDIINMLW